MAFRHDARPLARHWRRLASRPAGRLGGPGRNRRPLAAARSGVFARLRKYFGVAAGLVAAAGALGCASAELRTDAGDRYLQTWVINATVEEAVESVVGAAGNQIGGVISPSGSFGGATRIQASRQDRPEWQVLRQDAKAGLVWLKYRRRGGFPHDITVRIYPLDDKQVLLKAFSRSRMRFFNYRQNRRILSSLMPSLEAYWSHHGITARPSLGDHFLIPE